MYFKKISKVWGSHGPPPFNTTLNLRARDPQTSFFNKTFIINGFHGTIHTFKNYFAIVFSIFSFQQNKRYSNEPNKKWAKTRIIFFIMFPSQTCFSSSKSKIYVPTYKNHHPLCNFNSHIY